MYALFGVVGGEFLFEFVEEYAFKVGAVYGRKAVSHFFIRETNWLVIARNIAAKREFERGTGMVMRDISGDFHI